MIDDLKRYISIIILIIVGVISVECHKMYLKNKQLELHNKKMQQTKESQDKVIVITDKNQTKNKQLENKVNNKIKLVKNIKVRVLSQEQFIIKSNNVFKNFGNGN